MIKLYEEFIESLNSINEGVADKDWTRMIDLYALGKDGESVARAIKDKNKAINRFVAGMKISGNELSSSSFGGYYGKFRSFGDRAIELGATQEEIADVFNKTELPSSVTTKLSQYLKKNITQNRCVGSLVKKMIDLGFGVNVLKNGNALTDEGKDAMYRNGRKWTIGYVFEITLKDDSKVTLAIDAITDEGDGPTSYVYHRRESSRIFDKLGYSTMGVNKLHTNVLAILNA